MNNKTNMTRTKHSIINIVFAMLCFAVKTIMVFIVRRVFIHTLGVEYLGLNGLFANILTVLSLAEMGIGTAVSQAMYKPVQEGDDEKIGSILNFYKKVNFFISITVLTIGLVIIPFLRYIVNGEIVSSINLEVIYLLTLANTVVSYFFSYRKVVFSATQRADLESKTHSLFYIILYLLQIAVLIITHNYLFYLISIICITILENLAIYFVAKKCFPQYVKNENKSISKETKTTIKKNVLSLLCEKVGGAIVYGTDNILISAILIDGLAVLGKYSNYILITSSFITIAGLFINAITGSIGNSIVSNDAQYNRKLMNKLNFLYIWLISFFTIGFIVMSNDFIFYMLGSNLEISTLDIFLLGISFFLSQSRYILKAFKDTAGLFANFRIGYIIQAIINLVLSIILGKFIGLTGIILGTILSTVLMPLWFEPYVLYKKYFNVPWWKYMLKYLYYLLALGVGITITYFVCNLIPVNGILMAVVKFVVCVAVSNICILCMYVWLPEMKDWWNILKSYLKNHLFKTKK